jgi:predicted DsbA family dithiol-disulfide isomerase
MFTLLFVVPALSVPKRYPGFIWGPDNAQVAIEVFCDPLCPDCRDTWPTLQIVLGRYPTQINARVEPVNLPYHTWSYYSVISLYALNSTDVAKRMIDALYSANDQAKFSNDALAAVPEADIPGVFADYVAGKFGVDRAAFIANFNDAGIRAAAASTFGWAAEHGVDGTPTITFNGALTDLGPDSTVSDWTAIIDALLS